MKALVEHLEWVRLYLWGNLDGEKGRQIALDEMIAAMAVAEALPDVTIALPASPAGDRKPPERIIEVPEV